MESVAYVGMDVDKEKIAMSVVCGYEPEPRVERIIRNRADAITKFFTEVADRYDNLIACYEAGACGFELHRRVTELDVGCVVVAPSSIPRKANDRIKTDRRDARKLARELRNGNLSPVYVPTRKDEAARDYLRLYEDVKSDLKKTKQRLVHFLNRHEILCEEGRTWTVKYWKWLRALKFELPIARETFDEYIAGVEYLEERRTRIAEQIEQIAAEPCYEPAVKTLRAFRGIGTLTALSFVLEISDFRRFARAQQFMAFLGIVPSEHSSGDKRRVGSITKAGNSHLRKLLVEAAWHARSYSSAQTKKVMRERAGLPVEVVRYADRAGKRLHKKYWRLVHAGRPSQVAVTAVARELAGFIWGAMVGQTG